MSGRPPTRRAYARAIERMWTALHDRAVVLSERDWALIGQWHARSVPLAIVEEAVQAAAEKVRRGRRPPRSLAYLVPAVEEGCAAIREGRVERPSEPAAEPSAPRSAVDAWHWRQRHEAADSPLARLLGGLLARLQAGESPGAIDRALDAGLPEASPASVRMRVERAVEAELRDYRGRMPAATLRATRERAIAARLRKALALPRLSEGL